MKETENSILRTAARIFAERGYDKATLQQIADAVGIKKGSLYYYIEGKEDLLFRIADSTIESCIQRLEQATQGSLPPEKRLREAIMAHARVLAGDFERLCVFLHEQKALKADWRKKIVEKRDYYEHLFQEIIEEGIRQGRFRPMDARLATLALLGMCNWLYQWYHPEGRASVEEIGALFADLFLHGLLEPEAQPEGRPTGRKSSKKFEGVRACP